MAVDKEYIKWLKTQPVENLSPEQRRLRNLNPPEKGEIRNPEGGKKGVRHWSVHFQKLLDDPDFFHTFVKSVPSDWEGMIEGSAGKAIAMALVASTTRKCMEAVAKGEDIDRDTRDMVMLLNKLGYGEKIVYEAPDGFFNQPSLNFEVVQDREQKQED